MYIVAHVLHLDYESNSSHTTPVEESLPRERIALIDQENQNNPLPSGGGCSIRNDPMSWRKTWQEASQSPWLYRHVIIWTRQFETRLISGKASYLMLYLAVLEDLGCVFFVRIEEFGEYGEEDKVIGTFTFAQNETKTITK
ncbi:hypothetical protein COU13_00030 [Candidatus Kaiserbacteria bacterium CG10_big_fil_rev_8_21_14_0_10_43_70]|uniref:Uncharacterized protein n=1 Tax=Candidatus Kaiserbacteria bacterium CG10_big_fil_rev_8_21_14_0_10_43_70 TaxID=1974605 RepID=A0A2H0UJN4_9BACT|nr:MAG: hypothetical protein COU13_00030 [Candidatus Kaiserbacteria bacterium CG10_big_fil_rev_8_21_14_0_10_43_70]